MIASRLTTGKALVGRSGLSAHGRDRPPAPQPEPPETAASQTIDDIFDLARLRARDTNRVTFVISHWSNEHWNLVSADSFQVTDDDLIEYVAWPPQWVHRPTPGRLNWLWARHSNHEESQAANGPLAARHHT